MKILIWIGCLTLNYILSNGARAIVRCIHVSDFDGAVLVGLLSGVLSVASLGFCLWLAFELCQKWDSVKAKKIVTNSSATLKSKDEEINQQTVYQKVFTFLLSKKKTIFLFAVISISLMLISVILVEEYTLSYDAKCFVEGIASIFLILSIIFSSIWLIVLIPTAVKFLKNRKGR